MPHRRSRSGQPHDESGSALLTAGIVATLLLMLLLLASQTLLLLQRSTLAETVAFDAASRLASSPKSAETTKAAKQRARSILGPLAVVDVVSEGDPVIVSVSLPSPGLAKLGPGAVKKIVRTAQVRREDFREVLAP